MKVCAVIVTYGNRFHLLEQVMDACYKEGVDKVIVVDNASEENSRNQLKEYEIKNQERLKVIYLDENTGSAGGYKRGLKEAYSCKDCEYIWLLDDDNKPQKDSLKVLKEFWSNLLKEKAIDYSNAILLSFRPDRIAFKEAVVKNDPEIVLGRKNSFLGLHLLDIPKKIIRVLKRELNLQVFQDSSHKKSGKVIVAPYGGMFFHKNLLNTIGYPREEFYLYADDHEWSHRVIKNDGSIYVIMDSIVVDIDDNLNGEKSTSMFDAYINKNSSFKVYYAMRNKIIFEMESRVTNKIIYRINKFLFIVILNLFKRNHNIKRYNVIMRAISDAERKNFRVFKDEF